MRELNNLKKRITALQEKAAAATGHRAGYLLDPEFEALPLAERIRLMDEECERIPDAEMDWYDALPVSEKINLLAKDDEEIEQMIRANECRKAKETPCAT